MFVHFKVLDITKNTGEKISETK